MATKSASGGNLMGLSREDDSDRVVARFAVVRRDRMVVW